MNLVDRTGRSILVLVAGLLVGVLSVAFLVRVTGWGHNIPSPNIASDFAVALCWAIIIGLSISIWPISYADRKMLMGLWFLRAAVCLGPMLLYENHYGLDAYTYYLESKEVSYNWSSVGFGNGTANIGALVWIFQNFLPVFDSYHTIKLLFSFIGLLGIYMAYQGVVRYTGQSYHKLLLVLGVFPSLLFWSSILGKDPVMLFGVCLYAWGVLCWLRYQRSLVYIVAAAAGILLASWIRPWTALIFLPPTFLVGAAYIRGLGFRAVYLVSIGFSLKQAFASFVQHFSVISVDDLVKKTNIISKAWSMGGSRQAVPDFFSTGDMLAFAPSGMFAALFRPLPGEILNLFGTLAGVENALLLVLLALSFFRASKAKIKDPAVLWAITVVLTWSFVYGFVSYQNLGSAFRFRLQVLPILLVLLLYLSKALPVQDRRECLEESHG